MYSYYLRGRGGEGGCLFVVMALWWVLIWGRAPIRARELIQGNNGVNLYSENRL